MQTNYLFEIIVRISISFSRGNIINVFLQEAAHESRAAVIGGGRAAVVTAGNNDADDNDDNDDDDNDDDDDDDSCELLPMPNIKDSSQS